MGNVNGMNKNESFTARFKTSLCFGLVFLVQTAVLSSAQAQSVGTLQRVADEKRRQAESDGGLENQPKERKKSWIHAAQLIRANDKMERIYNRDTGFAEALNLPLSNLTRRQLKQLDKGPEFESSMKVLIEAGKPGSSGKPGEFAAMNVEQTFFRLCEKLEVATKNLKEQVRRFRPLSEPLQRLADPRDTLVNGRALGRAADEVTENLNLLRVLNRFLIGEFDTHMSSGGSREVRRKVYENSVIRFQWKRNETRQVSFQQLFDTLGSLDDFGPTVTKALFETRYGDESEPRFSQTLSRAEAILSIAERGQPGPGMGPLLLNAMAGEGKWKSVRQGNFSLAEEFRFALRRLKRTHRTGFWVSRLTLAEIVEMHAGGKIADRDLTWQRKGSVGGTNGDSTWALGELFKSAKSPAFSVKIPGSPPPRNGAVRRGGLPGLAAGLAISTVAAEANAGQDQADQVELERLDGSEQASPGFRSHAWAKSATRR